jgi:hypothetical protein
MAAEYWPELPEWISDNMVEEERQVDKELQRRYGASTKLRYVSLF